MFVQHDPDYAPCGNCGRRVNVNTVKYHTSPDKGPVYVFCGAECSLKWHQKEWDNPCKE